MPTSPLQIPDFRLYWLARFFAVLATMGMVVIMAATLLAYTFLQRRAERWRRA